MIDILLESFGDTDTFAGMWVGAMAHQHISNAFIKRSDFSNTHGVAKRNQFFFKSKLMSFEKINHLFVDYWVRNSTEGAIGIVVDKMVYHADIVVFLRVAVVFEIMIAIDRVPPSRIHNLADVMEIAHFNNLFDVEGEDFWEQRST